MTNTTCEGCGATLTPVELALIATTTHKIKVCDRCVRARARAATTGGRCKCGNMKRPTDVLGKPGRRQWIACNRCLGTIKQVA